MQAPTLVGPLLANPELGPPNCTAPRQQTIYDWFIEYQNFPSFGHIRSSGFGLSVNIFSPIVFTYSGLWFWSYDPVRKLLFILWPICHPSQASRFLLLFLHKSSGLETFVQLVIWKIRKGAFIKRLVNLTESIWLKIG